LLNFSLNTDFQFTKRSIAKIYSSDLIGTKSLSVIPKYKGAMAVSGDTLSSEIEPGVFELLNDKVAPLQSKFESLIANSDSIMQSLNVVLDTKTRKNLKQAINSFKNSLLVFEGTSKTIDAMIKGNQNNFNKILNNSKDISENLKQFTDTLSGAEIAGILNKFKTTLNNLNGMLSDINTGKGSVGKLLNDDKLYQNFTNASKELEELLRDMKLHPKRFVHFSLFGKKDKAYKPTPKDSLK